MFRLKYRCTSVHLKNKCNFEWCWYTAYILSKLQLRMYDSTGTQAENKYFARKRMKSLRSFRRNCIQLLIGKITLRTFDLRILCECNSQKQLCKYIAHISIHQFNPIAKLYIPLMTRIQLFS